MKSPAEIIAALPVEERDRAINGLTDEERDVILWDWRFWARPEQLAPEGDWSTWLVLAGRGFGKTRCGAEWVREEVEAGRAKRIAIVAETAADARDVLVEGGSGLLGVHHPDRMPIYEPSKRRITWPNGAVATLYNGREPDQLRGPQHDLALVDELAKFRYAQETWDQLQFGMRLGERPRVAITTTPRPIPIIRELLRHEGESVHVTRGRTLDNRVNLAPSFIKTMRDKYEGTRLGRQELDAEILDDVPGALWTRKMLDDARVHKDKTPDMKRVLISVDPAITSDETTGDPDEHGIVAVGICERRHGYVIDDASLIGTPQQWARRAAALYDLHSADGYVVETNQGGDMVEMAIRSVRPHAKVIRVHASRGKHLRAEPISALFEQERCHMIGSFPEMEDQMTLMTAQGYMGDRSPDRLDAMVHGLTELFKDIIRPEAKPMPPRRRRTGWAA